MPKTKNIFLPLISGEDPNTIDFYIKRLIACSDALTAIQERYPCFEVAQYEARNKEMLCIYALLEMIQGQITDIKQTQAFRQPSGQSLRALVEVMPEFKAYEDFSRGKNIL